MTEARYGAGIAREAAIVSERERSVAGSARCLVMLPLPAAAACLHPFVCCWLQALVFGVRAAGNSFLLAGWLRGEPAILFPLNDLRACNAPSSSAETCITKQKLCSENCPSRNKVSSQCPLSLTSLCRLKQRQKWISTHRQEPLS